MLSHPDARPIVGPVGRTVRNLNDNLGLPLVVLRFRNWAGSRTRLAWWMCIAPFRAVKLAASPSYPRVLVLEYALSFDGDIPRLARLARPDIAVVTAVGPAHLEVVGSIENVAQAKGALARAVPPSGLVVLGRENPYLTRMTEEAKARVVTVSGAGRTMAENAARVVGDFLGLPGDVTEAALRDLPPLNRRLCFHHVGPVTLIDDAFNANPLSMKLALETLRNAAAPGQRTVAVLGYMGELGTAAETYHQEIGTVAHTCADVVVGVGTLARHYAPNHWFESARACADHVRDLLCARDVVLVKGSSSSKMYDVADRIRGVAGSLES